jgi:hypothetical protein
MTSRTNRDEALSRFGENDRESRDRYRTSAIVVGLFVDRDKASNAIAALREVGFNEEEIGIAMQDREDDEDLMKASGPPTAEGAIKGAISGGLVGGALGLLGSLLIPGLGPVVAGGVLGTVLAGAGIGAATGGMIGSLIGLGVSREDAEHFDRGFRDGGILVTVRAGARAMEARSILRERNADLGPSFEGEAFADEESESSGDRTLFARTWNEMGNESLASWSGRERRTGSDLSYAGPERREEY